MDVVTYALCRKLAGTGGSVDTSALEQEIETLKTTILELEAQLQVKDEQIKALTTEQEGQKVGMQQQEAKLQEQITKLQQVEIAVGEVEVKVDAINPDVILTELTEVRDELSKKVSARVATI